MLLGLEVNQNMSKPLPKFRYHPEPLATGAIVVSEEKCECCGSVAGYKYVASFYAVDEVLSLCPWCIASGEAAEKFEGSFSDDWPLNDAGLSQSIIREVTTRTPGFETWQQEEWLTHCEDACAFLGDATVRDIKELAEGRGRVEDGQEWKTEDFLELAKYYKPKGSPALYKFECLHCHEVLYGLDQC